RNRQRQKKTRPLEAAFFVGRTLPRSIVAIDLLAPFVPLLGFDRQCRDGTCIEALQADRFAGFLAIAVGAFVDAADRGIDLGNELALAVASAQFERAFRFGGSAIRDVGMLHGIILKMLQRLAVLLEDVLFPFFELAA